MGYASKAVSLPSQVKQALGRRGWRGLRGRGCARPETDEKMQPKLPHLSEQISQTMQVYKKWVSGRMLSVLVSSVPGCRGGYSGSLGKYEWTGSRRLTSKHVPRFFHCLCPRSSGGKFECGLWGVKPELIQVPPPPLRQVAFLFWASLSSPEKWKRYCPPPLAGNDTVNKLPNSTV